MALTNLRFPGEVVFYVTIAGQRLLPLFLLFFVFSCTPDQKTNVARTSDFEKIVEKAALKIDAGQHDAALKYVDSAFASLKDPTVEEKFGYYKFYCGYHYNYQKNYAKARLYADSMLVLLNDTGEPANYARPLAETNYSLGDIMFSQGKYNEAYKYFYNAKLIGKTTFDPCNISDYSYRLGMILYKQSRFRNAARYFQQSFEESASCKFDFGSFYRRQELLNNTALSYMKLGMADSALYYYSHALDYINANDGKFPEKSLFYEVARGVVYGNQGQIYKIQGNLAQAEKLFKQSIAINSKPNHDNRDAQFIQLHLAELYFQDKRMDALQAELEVVKSSLAALPNTEVEMSLHNLLWQYYQVKGDDSNALGNLLEYNRLKDSLAKSNRDLTEADVSEQLDILEKQYEINFLKKDKEVNNLYLRIVAVIAIMSVVIVLLILQNWRRSKTNVLELKKLNRQVMDQKIKLEQTLNELEQQGREKDRILRAVAHDLRNPIGGVASVSGLLIEEEEITEEQREMLSLIQHTCQDALQLINEILEITVINTSVPEAYQEKVDINVLLFNAIELLRFKATEKNQQISFEALPETQIVRINREKIARVISNLISNAIKFSPSGGHIQVKAMNHNGRIRVAVKDNGIGIPDTIKSKVFDTFTEAKRPGTSGEKPFGLGLSISRQIVEAHAGKIWFESETGKGSTFYIELTGQKEALEV